ncbi:MAG: type II secretion system F family protein, partial [Patescibacteria group bacterium]
MLFTYTARAKNGKELTGTIEAASKLEAADRLFNERQLNVVALEQTKGTPKAGGKPDHGKTTGSKDSSGETQADTRDKTKPRSIIATLKSLDTYLVTHSKVKAQDKAIAFRLLSVMINAGLSIVKSLRVLSEQVSNKKLGLILADTADRVEGGNSFSQALAEHGEVFTQAEIGIIAAGEASGQLNKTLTSLAIETEKSANLSRKIRSAMIYPGVVLTVLVGAVILLMTLVIPKLSELFVGSGVELPLSTRILVGTSNWFIASTLHIPNWLLVTFILVGGVVFLKFWKKSPTGKVAWDGLMLRLPLFGQLNQKAALASFARQLALLSSSGVAIVRAIEITANAVGNEVYRQRLLEVKEDVERGIPIHKIIEHDKLFPDLVVSMILVGEQTAQLGSVSEKIAEFYDEEIEIFVKNLSTIMEPVIIVIIGTLVGGLVAAIMQPIMDITDIAAKA